MEQQSIIGTFKIFLDRTHYIGTIVPLNLFIRNCSSGSYRDFLEQCEALWNDKELIKNWKGDANEKYYRLWYLGIAQLVHCHLNQGKLCKDVALLSAYFELLFKNVSFDLPKLPKSLPVLALRDYEKKHLEQRDFSQLVLDIDMAPHPENKLKYVCNYLFNDNDMETLAELLDFYGEKYAPPIEASVLINYWTAKRLCGEDHGCFWKALRHLVERADGRELFGQEQLALLNGDEFIQAMAAVRTFLHRNPAVQPEFPCRCH